MRKLLLTALLLGALAQVQGQFYYGLRQDFGKNRVQFHEFDWTFYRFEQFDVYFYRGNDGTGHARSQSGPSAVAEN
ncbi:MAG: hypothetical protein U5L96_18895 [Owenweeksia sp.]|nr:hypothetical protein [Owenweeksia sp.]